jgi:hypothetical protein
MLSTVWELIGEVWLYLFSMPRLIVYATIPVAFVLLGKWLYDNRRIPNSIVIQDITYGAASFNCVVVMIKVDGKWRPAVSQDIVHLPPWEMK